jgi:proteasome accessory factor C
MNLSLETVLRCLDLVPIVRENQGIELPELARRVGIPEKIIAKQLIPMLLLCGAPPYLPHDYVGIWLEDNRVYVSFADHFRRPVTLLPIELVALHLALSSLAYTAEDEADVETRISELQAKIERALPPEQRVFLDQAERVSVDDHAEASPWAADIAQAIQGRGKLRIDYLSFGETRLKRRVIHPYGLLVKDGVTYVPSFDELRGHVVSFRLDRIHAVQPLPEPFAVDPSFSLERWAKDGIAAAHGDDEHELTVEVGGRTARWISEVFDQKQWSWRDRDTLILRLPTSRLQAAVRWALSLGADAEVVAPPEARRLAAAEIAALGLAYES